MCGICVALFTNCDEKSTDNEITKTCQVLRESNLQHRGPDCQNTRRVSCALHTDGIFYGSTLHFRGSLTPQPLCDHTGNVLLWNGEIFSGIEVQPDENDSHVLLGLLSQCRDDTEILQIFAKIKGPWSFIYWQVSKKQLWFGRDIFGRRSLLYHSNTGHHIILSSIAISCWMPWQEVPAVGIYCTSLDRADFTAMPEVTLYPWATPGTYSQPVIDRDKVGVFNQTLMSKDDILENFVVREGMFHVVPPVGPFNDSVAELSSEEACADQAYGCLNDLATDEDRRLAQHLIHMLEDAVRCRTSCQSDKCSECIQQSLAHIHDHAAGTGTCTNEEGKFVSNIRCHERECVHKDSGSIASGIDTHTTSGGTNPRPSSKYEHQSAAQKYGTAVGSTPSNDNSTSNLTQLSCEGGALNDSPIGSPEGLTVGSGCGHPRVAVLFSGGVDSLLMAAMADRCIQRGESIDLLNVAFQQVPKTSHGKQKATPNNCFTSSYDVPDRVTGYDGLQQLQDINPHRKWNFIEVNVTVEELKEARSGHVQDLLHPLHTVLDDSIGCALWFAARGRGVIRTPMGSTIPYTSPARILLVGMGADEQFAGYSRHRVKFNTGGWPGLMAEIKMEVERISSRNLGRDDRVISDHGRESRLPFLDENFVTFVSGLPLERKTKLHLPRGIGEKFLLRLAAESVGLTRGAVAPKRAIQFGSKIAKVENRKEKGSDMCDRLLNRSVSKNS